MKLLILSLLSPLLLLSGCKGSNTAYDVAHEACVASETAAPVVQSLIPVWGATVNDVVALICAIPAVIADFQSLPAEQAKAKTEARITAMASAGAKSTPTAPVAAPVVPAPAAPAPVIPVTAAPVVASVPAK